MTLLESMRWHRTSEKKPPEGHTVLFYDGKGITWLGHYDGFDYYIHGRRLALTDGVIAKWWCLIPTLPKENEGFHERKPKEGV